MVVQYLVQHEGCSLTGVQGAGDTGVGDNRVWGVWGVGWRGRDKSHGQQTVSSRVEKRASRVLGGSYSSSSCGRRTDVVYLGRISLIGK